MDLQDPDYVPDEDSDIPTGSGPIEPIHDEMDMDGDMTTLTEGQFTSTKGKRGKAAADTTQPNKPKKKKKRSKTSKKATKASPVDALYKNVPLATFAKKNIKVPSSAVITCGCGAQYKPKGFGSHRKACSSAAEAVVSNN